MSDNPEDNRNDDRNSTEQLSADSQPLIPGFSLHDGVGSDNVILHQPMIATHRANDVGSSVMNTMDPLPTVANSAGVGYAYRYLGSSGADEQINLNSVGAATTAQLPNVRTGGVTRPNWHSQHHYLPNFNRTYGSVRAGDGNRINPLYSAAHSSALRRRRQVNETGNISRRVRILEDDNDVEGDEESIGDEDADSEIGNVDDELPSDSVHVTMDGMHQTSNILLDAARNHIDRTIEHILNTNVDRFNNLGNEISQRIEDSSERRVVHHFAAKYGLGIDELIAKMNGDVSGSGDGGDRGNGESFTLDESKIAEVVQSELRGLTEGVVLTDDSDRVEYMSDLIKNYRELLHKHFDEIVRCEVKIKAASKKIFKLNNWLKSLQRLTEEIFYEFGEEEGEEGDSEREDGMEGEDGGVSGSGEEEGRNSGVDGDSAISLAMAGADEAHSVESITDEEAKTEIPVSEEQRRFYKSIEQYSKYLIEKINLDNLICKYEVSKKCFSELLKLGQKLNGVQSSNICIICTTKPVDIVIIPCGHTCCSDCLKKLNQVTSVYERKCFICRKTTNTYQKLFFI